MNAEQRFRQVLEDISTCMNGGTATRCEWLTILTWIMQDAKKALDEFPDPAETGEK
jgi:hypothetical protein